ncbi:ATP-binding protein [candidate division TA06 bacterium]|uniref:ATP-binding protein n=1 Tax=candidate division TA06 bacterium TaxID=2250710 RepID=A0A933MHQ1_UNCT6|nr:ATP-binding protein [candidate division TA06 bacterium]
MNNNHSHHEWIYKKRLLAGPLAQALKSHRVLVLSGARQTGKSTLLQNEEPFCGWPYITLDDYEALKQARQSPSGLWAGKAAVVIDEAQKAPELLPALKRDVDRGKVRAVLSGSSNPLLMKHVSESLAGRAAYFGLGPMSLSEEAGHPPKAGWAGLMNGQPSKPQAVPQRDYLNLMLRGMLPPLLWLDGEKQRALWWESYVATYLERDLRQITAIEGLPDFRRLMAAVALRSGQPVNQTELSRELGLSQPTIYRHLGLLEATNLFYKIPAFSRNRGKRLLKSPKAYWLDAGLACFLSGHYGREGLKNSREAGGIFETLVLSQIKAWSETLTPRPSVYYWRTADGREVDFVIAQGRRVLPVEVKLGPKVTFSDTGNLRMFMEYHPEARLGVVIYGGDKVEFVDEKIIALPLAALF